MTEEERAMSDTLVEADSLVADIVEMTNVCGGQKPDDMPRLWAELSMWRNIPASATTSSNVQRVFESLGEAWDEDFLDEDGNATLSAVEAVHSCIRKLIGNVDEEEADEDGQLVAQERDISANTSLWNIRNVIQDIREDRLNLNPEWQRSFVWKPRKQKALIESLFLGLPVPSFLIYKDSETGKMSVIDGRQRLETISRFTSPKEKKGEPRIRFRTFSSNQEGWREGQFLNPAAGKFYDDLPQRFRTQFDTTTLQVAVLDVPLDHLYQIFKRYNTGSVALNAAEIRNAVFQTSELHTMMFRMAGEHRDMKKYLDKREQQIGEDLRGVMKNKQVRYGSYDFIGRFLAFRNETKGSVATAIFSFMARHRRADAKTIEEFRKDFLDSFEATSTWYEYPLTEPRVGGAFHAFLATIQMVSSSHVLALIREGGASEARASEYVRSSWVPFTERVLNEKQNSTNFWKYQKEWVSLLSKAASKH
jgi:hypothetical protein